ncbi:MIP18 family protein [Babesia bigemina]|uniref:MIP18 family protein n=1 Tax=Babesia bigemina TaxID=5866 RepID=A0A061DEI7_BABBI|nr:MIP18 family protein [Babesia bigemina]CDR97350.1 MIP18 family protein [Babesia bigemina]|eukprot:XP_012769536.1 MIP18 family protein [Babesia bigemina]
MDNVNPVLYKKTNGPSTIESQERFILSKKATSYFYIDHHMALDSDEEAKAEDKAANSLFQPTTGFEPFEVQEIFDIIRDIKDPEYSYTLENLKVLEEHNIHIDNDNSIVTVHFTPTVPHCSQATVIGLMIYVKLRQSLPPRFKIDVQIAEGSHNNEKAINKQLLDKERVAAALENPVLLELINDGIYYNSLSQNGLINI